MISNKLYIIRKVSPIKAINKLSSFLIVNKLIFERKKQNVNVKQGNSQRI